MLEDRKYSTPQPSGPLFLVGAPRSGTTLVYKLLCLHPDTAWISNWVRKFPALPQLAALNAVPKMLPGMRQRAWFGEDSNAYVYGSRRRLGERLFPAPAEGEPVFRRAGLGEEEISDPCYVDPHTAEELRRAFATIRRFSSGDCLVSKRVANNRRIPLLGEAFPGARFVEIVRDGRAVAHSLSTVDWWRSSTVWWNGMTPAEWEAQGGDPWVLCARAWIEELEVTRRGLATLAPSRVLQIRYEDFVAQPEELLEEIRRFASLPRSHRWSKAVGACDVRPCRSAWKERLSEQAVSTIEGIQSEMLRLHGYATGPLESARTLSDLRVEAPQAL